MARYQRQLNLEPVTEIAGIFVVLFAFLLLAFLFPPFIFLSVSLFFTNFFLSASSPIRSGPAFSAASPLSLEARAPPF